MKRIIFVLSVIVAIIVISGCDKADDGVYTRDPWIEDDDGMVTISYCEECAPLIGKYDLKFARFAGGWGPVPGNIGMGYIKSGYITLDDSSRLVCFQEGTSTSTIWPFETTDYHYKKHYIYKIVNDSMIAFKRHSQRDTAEFSPYLSENPVNIEEIIIQYSRKYIKNK